MKVIRATLWTLVLCIPVLGLPVPASAGGLVSKPSSVSLALIFDYKIPTDQLPVDEQAYGIQYDWGASSPEEVDGTAEHDYYIPWAQGYCPGVPLTSLACPSDAPPSYPWLIKHHPDWILWQTNKKGIPTKIAHNAGDPGPILDFTNRTVQQYWYANFIKPALEDGYNGISWDNPTAYNSYGAVGHWDKGHKHFIKLYSGARNDESWTTAQAAALAKFLATARSDFPNVKFALNASLDCSYASSADWAKPLASVNTIVDEEGYSYWGNNNQWIEATRGKFCPNRWLTKTDSMISQQAAGKRVVVIDASPLAVSPDLTVTDPTARAEIQWDLANYFLIKGQSTLFWYGQYQMYGYPPVPQPEESLNIGAPRSSVISICAMACHLKGEEDMYERVYRSGMVVVNPNPVKSFTVVLPKNKYQTVYGRAVNSYVMGPHSGLLLDKRGSRPIL